MTKSAMVEAPQNLQIDVEGHLFFIVSDQPTFMQGGCTTPKNYERVVGVQKYLNSHNSLLVDFQGERRGQGGEIYFAVIRPTDVLDWGATWVHLAQRKASHRNEECDHSNYPGLILDMECRGNVTLMKQLLANQRILKVGFCCCESLQIC